MATSPARIWPRTLSVQAMLKTATARFGAACQRIYDAICYHLYTFWLITCNDFPHIIYPSTLFAVSNGVACMLRDGHEQSDAWCLMLTRLPSVFAWLWFNLLAFDIDNQIRPTSAHEDRLNKPWRPIPAGRITVEQGKRISLVASPLAVVASVVCGGGMLQCGLLLFFYFLYNDLQLGDRNWIARNALNACGFIFYATGALEVALQTKTDLSEVPWLTVLGLVVCTTVHMQDLYDTLGDAAAGRRTIPIIIGDVPTRWTLTIAICLWTVLGPAYRGLTVLGSLGPLALNVWVLWRLWTKRTVEADRKTFRLLNMWFVTLYTLPLVQSYGF